jgi:hypothetical protein
MSPVHHSWLWFDGNQGLISGLIFAGFGFGSFCVNFLLTALINPDGAEQDKETLLYPEKVNERFGYMLKWLLALYIVCIVFAFITIFPGP